MARRMVGDNQDVYRVVVVGHRFVSATRNYDGEEYTHTYGPYNTLGAARCQLTHNTRGYRGCMLAGIVSARIEKAATVWTEVPNA